MLPWPEVEAVYVWCNGVGIWAVWCVGVQRRDGGDRRSFVREITSVAVPDPVPRQVSYDSRPVLGWRLDRERLAAAVARFAPGVPVVTVD